MFVFDCPDHHWTWHGCNLPAAVPKLSPDDLQTALYFQAKGRWSVDSHRQEGKQVSHLFSCGHYAVSLHSVLNLVTIDTAKTKHHNK